jgi:hypothetical protein
MNRGTYARNMGSIISIPCNKCDVHVMHDVFLLYTQVRELAKRGLNVNFVGSCQWREV